MKIEIKLKPFTVPNFVILEQKPGRREDGIQAAPSIPLADMAADDLAAMCDKFRADVFAKAGKADTGALTQLLEQKNGT